MEKHFDFIENGVFYDIQTSQRLFKDVIIINDESYNHNFIRIIEGNFVYFLNINQIIYITQTQ
ncbi:hypothetical protein HW276_02155 [Leptotrichia sp. oral taxon 417]|uniref:hypothetical protein n=1 Tax=Leptotrichia sp. oral taxon 417 TaxID=712365 RepID=UPI0015BE5CCF|nr:hypothetical protein [Leptotrichia sp. oral taxon 417]NWO26539.1 hypothetical protein [Leptotrichia sp. oral taxon 417]